MFTIENAQRRLREIGHDVSDYEAWLRTQCFSPPTKEAHALAKAAWHFRATYGLRPAVRWFAEQMEAALRRNDHKGGWSNDDAYSLLERMREETEEIHEVLGFCTNKITSELHASHVIKEAADAANFAMMIADNHGPHFGAIRVSDRSDTPQPVSGEE